MFSNQRLFLGSLNLYNQFNKFFEKSHINTVVRGFKVTNILSKMSTEILNLKDDKVTENKYDNKYEGDSQKTNKKVPNFFLAFKIDNVEIHQNIKKFQEEVITTNPTLNEALIDLSTLHVTLGVTHLKNEIDIGLLKEKLNEWANKNINFFFNEPLILSFTGIGTFNDTVTYVDVEKSDNYKKLCELAKTLNEVFLSCGFLTFNKTFTPHLTVLKLSKSHKLLKKRRSFKDAFRKMRDCTDHFGIQKVKHIQLLSMDEPKCANGYYECFHEISVD